MFGSKDPSMNTSSLTRSHPLIITLHSIKVFLKGKINLSLDVIRGFLKRCYSFLNGLVSVETLKLQN
jgi:hypothetical protein